MQEFLLAECRVKKLYDTSIIAVGDKAEGTSPVEIYNAAGVRIPALQKGVNIVKMPNGQTRKVLVK